MTYCHKLEELKKVKELLIDSSGWLSLEEEFIFVKS